MGIVDIIPWKEKTARAVEKNSCHHTSFAFHKNWLSLPSVLGGTTYREPECEVTERPRDFVITARLPGVRRDEIELTLGRRTMRLRAEHRAEVECLRRGVTGWHAAQRTYFRTFRLPVKVHPETAKVASGRACFACACRNASRDDPHRGSWDRREAELIA